MKKKILLRVILLALAICSVLLLAACDNEPAGGGTGGGGGTPSTPQKTDITGVSFEGNEVTYNGTSHTIRISGTVPAGVSIVYTGNTATDAGTYTATATLSGEGYNTLTLTATLKIKRAVISGITFTDKIVSADGSEQSVVIAGELPAGTSVAYENNKGTDQGTYHATATITGSNYETLVLNASLIIKPDLSTLATEVIGSVLTVPDIWQFLPDTLRAEKLGYNSAPTTDFASGFVSASAIPTKVIGKQMNVVYDALNGTETVFSALKIAYASAEAITTLYQGYINQNPDDYAEFSDTAGTVRFKIKLDGADYLLLLQIGTADLELAFDSENGICRGRIQLSDSNAVKYEMSAEHLKISLSIVGLSLHQIEFVQNEDAVVGYLYEYMGVESASLCTSAMITVDDYYTTIISNKRESDDLGVEGEVEIYDNATGCLIGTEKKEKIALINFDTKWFPLTAITGIQTIKVAPLQNDKNASTVYINGSSTPLAVMNVSSFNPSRRFDIEMRTVWVLVWNATDEAYEKQKIEIPMLFVQSENLNTFTADFFEVNEANGMSSAPTFTLSGAVNAYIADIYAELLPFYAEIKDAVAYADIVAYIGEKNEFFTPIP